MCLYLLILIILFPKSDANNDGRFVYYNDFYLRPISWNHSHFSLIIKYEIEYFTLKQFKISTIDDLLKRCKFFLINRNNHNLLGCDSTNSTIIANLTDGQSFQIAKKNPCKVIPSADGENLLTIGFKSTTTREDWTNFTYFSTLHLNGSLIADQEIVRINLKSSETLIPLQFYCEENKLYYIEKSTQLGTTVYYAVRITQTNEPDVDKFSKFALDLTKSIFAFLKYPNQSALFILQISKKRMFYRYNITFLDKNFNEKQILLSKRFSFKTRRRANYLLNDDTESVKLAQTYQNIGNNSNITYFMPFFVAHKINKLFLFIHQTTDEDFIQVCDASINTLETLNCSTYFGDNQTFLPFTVSVNSRETYLTIADTNLSRIKIAMFDCGYFKKCDSCQSFGYFVNCRWIISENICKAVNESYQHRPVKCVNIKSIELKRLPEDGYSAIIELSYSINPTIDKEIKIFVNQTPINDFNFTSNIVQAKLSIALPLNLSVSIRRRSGAPLIAQKLVQMFET